MDQIKQHYRPAIMTYITLSMVSIIAVGLITIFVSFWITDLADQDAQAINLSGTMRMQTYRIAYAIEQNDYEQAEEYLRQLDQTWQHSLFTQQRKDSISEALNHRFDLAFTHWQHILAPAFAKIIQSRGLYSTDAKQIATQVKLTDDLVSSFQNHAEIKIFNLRGFQLFALFVTISVGSVIFYITKNRIEKPLLELTDTAEKIGKGEFGHQADIDGRDELALLGAVINQMSTSIKGMYEEMDERVKQRTQALHEHNVTLTFLFRIAREILDNQQNNIDFQGLLDELGSAIGNDVNLELCLFTQQGETPYLHIAGDDKPIDDCSTRSCETCQGSAPFCATAASATTTLNVKFPIVRDALSYGVINISSSKISTLPEWQTKLLCSVSDQYALALSLSNQKNQEHRLAMLTERTVIARELHDSLAQALSYLQIQVTRIQKNHDKGRHEAQQEVIEELREGLSSAYRQLRELLTTFRLKVDAEGLKAAIKNTIAQLSERSSMEIKLHYNISNLPLTPSEEIHLLQIIREALQNAAYHSKGTEIQIELTQDESQDITLRIVDNGIGIPDSPEKLNHYGLAIMTERSKHLRGHLEINNVETGGAEVSLRFTPEYIQTSKRKEAG